MCLHWSFINWSGMIILQAVLRVTQTPSWYLPDTFQTPSNLVMLALWRASVGKAVVDFDDTNYFLSMVIPSIQSWQYPGSIRHHPDTLQTPPRLYPITSEPRTSTWDLKKHLNRFDWLGNILIGCWIIRRLDCVWGVWRVSGWCLIDPGYCQDCIDGIAV